MASVAGRRYAQAVTQLAREQGTFDAWEEDLAQLQALVADPGAVTFLANPSVDEDEKHHLLDVGLARNRPEVRNLAHLLLRRHRLQIVPDLVEAFTEARLAEQGIAVAEVTTAEPLDPEGQQAVRERLERIVGKKIELRMKTDPSIIGGIVARIGDQVIDGSVVNQLRQLRQRLSTGVGPSR